MSQLNVVKVSKFEQIEKDELLLAQRRKVHKRQSSKLDEECLNKKKDSTVVQLLNRENLIKLEQFSREKDKESNYSFQDIPNTSQDINEYETPVKNPKKLIFKTSSKNVVTTGGKPKIKFGISAFKE